MIVIKNSVAIFGLARSGISLKNFLQKNFDIKIYLFDDNVERLEKFRDEKNVVICGADEIEWNRIDFLIMSPGIDIRKSHVVTDSAKNYGVKIVVDIELFYLFLRENNSDAKIVGITGTNGKSTTTALLGHILKSADLDVQIGGNIGIPVFDLNFDSKFYIFEISSYQLDLLSRTRFDVGVLLNITPDHLDRYNFKIENYIHSKEKIFEISEEIVFGIDSDITNEIYYDLKSSLKKIKTVSVGDQNADFVCQIEKDRDVIKIKDSGEVMDCKSNLIGAHNRENIAAAFAICNLLHVNRSDTISGIESFKGLAHRLQFVCSYENIDFINDSKSTTGDSTGSAINALNENHEIYLIVGGVPKSDGLKGLVNLLHDVKKFYLIGEASGDFGSFLKDYNCDFEFCEKLEAACRNSLADSLKSNYNGKKVVLLSPACASFDQFRDFEDRGEQFINIVKNLIIEENFD